MNEFDVLLVEDNRGDVRLVERAFESRGLPGTVHVVRAADEALERLRREGEHASGPRIDVVLLDLNLPATKGLDVLETIKSDAGLRPIPVIVLTSTKSDDDIREAYRKGANACLLKPVDPSEFADRIEGVVDFWADRATLPTAVGSLGGA